MNNQQCTEFAFGSRKTLILWLFVSIIFTVLQIQQSLRQGQLALPPDYDDVMYFRDALGRLGIIYENGIIDFLKNYMSVPPHTPLGTLIPLIGYLIFGIRDWAPAAINGVLVFCSLVFFDYLARKLPIIWRFIIVTITLTWLIMEHLVIECRPDIFCGLLTVIFVVLITEKPWLSASKKRHFIVGIFIGLTLIAKPTFSFIAITLAVWTLLAVSLTDIFIGGYRGKIFQVLIPQFRALGLAVLITIPHYIFAFNHLFNYLYSILFSQSDIWQANFGKLTLTEDLLYYLTGQGGTMMMGNWLYFWLLILIVTASVISYRHDWSSMIRVPAFVGTTLIAYALLTSADAKTPFIGVVISCFFLVTAVQMLVYLLESCQKITLSLLRKFIYLAVISLYVSSILIFQWPWPNDLVSAKPKSLAEMKYQYEFLHTIYDDIRKDSISKNLWYNPNNINNTNINIYMTANGHWLNPQIWDFYTEKIGDRAYYSYAANIPMNAHFISLDLQLHKNLIDKSSYIIAFNQGNPDTIKWLPITQIEGDILSYIRGKKDIKLIKTYTNPFTNGKIFLYSKMFAFLEDRKNINFRQGELSTGEYLRGGWSSPEEWGTWTNGNQASIVFRLDQKPTGTREMSVKISRVFTTVNYPQQRILVSLNGNLIKTVTLNRENLSLPMIVNIPLPQTLLNFDALNTITFDLPDAITPQKLGESDDTRLLGVGIEEIKISSIKTKN